MANPLNGKSICSCLLAVLALAGCATPDRGPEPAAPVQIAESTWWQVDSDIAAASLAATSPARNYARGSLESWRKQVRQRIDEDFIPWFSGYWTQQWLAIKVAWFKLGSGEGVDPTLTRLAAYLQEEYQERVLKPEAREIDPELLRQTATKLYLQILGEQLEAIPQRHGIPRDQFDQRLKRIAAIALAPPPTDDASLYEIVHAHPLSSLPAYRALFAHLGQMAGGAGSGPSEDRISPVAKRASEKVVAKLAARGAASAAAAAIGGVAGMVISLAAAGYGAILHENERPAIEAQLRENLNAALDETCQRLIDDPGSGVMAPVHYLSRQIEAGLATSVTQPVELEPAPQPMPLPDEPVFESETSEDEESDAQPGDDRDTEE